jgi:autotransporter-associated beta strand protein
MSKKLNHSLALGILLIGILFSYISEGFSQTTNYTWNNSTNTWSATTAWDPTGGPQSSSGTANTNVAVFASVGTGNNTVLLGSDRTVYGLVFTNGANAYSLGSVSTAKQLDIMSGVGLQNVSGQNQIFNLSVANNGTGLWTNSSGSTTTFNNGLNLTTSGSTASRTLTLGGAGTWNVASAIANGGTATAGVVTVTATGNTTLSGNNTYDGRTTMNAAGGTLTLSGDNSGAAGGVTLTAGTLNINNNNALGTGALSLAGTGATINNTSGAAVVNAGNQAWAWSDGLAFGASGNNANNNLDLGTGVVTASSTRTIALAGSGTKLTMGAVNITSASSGRTITANGVGNTLEMGGLTLSASPTPVTVTLAGTANIGVTGAIVSGAVAGNGLTVNATGTTALSGANTYTGLTTMNAAGGTLTLSGNNSAASGGVRVTAGTVNVNSANALGTGTLTLDGTGAAINNTSGAAVTNLGNNAVLWDGSSTSGFTFGTSASTSGNYNLNLGTGTVTAGTSRIMTFAGSGTTLTMGTLDSTTTSGSNITFTINGANNTLVLGGYKIRSGTPTSLDARSDTLTGSANLTINGVIENGNAYSNGLKITGTGVTTFSGNNTYDGLTTMNNALGTLTLSGNNSGAGGGVTLTAGTLNINNNNALGTGALSLAGTGATINNTSGSAVGNAGNQSWAWQDGLTFGASGNNANNNLDLGTGVVTLDGTKTMNLVGNGTKLTIGAVNITSTSSGRNLTFNGVGNTLEMRGLTLSANTTTNVTVLLAGSANINVTGAIVNGQSFANGVNITNTAITTFSGQNTYTGATEIKSGATLRYGADNVTADNGGRILVDGTFNLESYSDTISAMRVTAGGRVQGTGTLTANSVDSSGGYSFALYGENQISANLAGSAATLFKSTAGSVSLLSGNNSYGGATTVTSGTIKMGSSTALGSAEGSTTVSSNAQLDLNGQTGVDERTIFTGTGTLLNSAVGTTASVNGTMELGSEMVVNTIGDITLNGQLTGGTLGGSTRTVTKTGSGLLKVTASNSTFLGTNRVSAGTLLVDTGASIESSRSVVDNGGLLKVNGTAGAVTVNIGGTLGGSGTVGAVTLKDGSFLKPGNSPGLLTASLASWEAGSTYNWEIDQASGGTAGVNWDVFSVVNALDLSALSSSAKMNLVLNSLASVDDFNPNSAYSWVFAQAGSFIGTDLTDGANVTDLFNITAGTFAGDVLPTTGFKIEVGTDSASSLRTLSLTTIPEPSTGSMLGLGFAGLVVTRLLRRKIS